MTAVFRFAPSPNGPLHLGHAYSALLNADMARAAGGRLLVRLEDIDLTRARPEHERSILDDLQWLGLPFEKPVRRQSEHLATYRALLERLAADGLVYPSFMTRRDLRDAVAARGAAGKPVPTDPDGAVIYPGTERDMPVGERSARMASGEPFAWRLDMAGALQKLGEPPGWIETGAGPVGETGRIQANPGAWGDVVIARKDVPASYHLAVVADDALQGVTHVVRGRDLFHATAIHRLLQALLGLPAPIYHHHSLILGPDGRKLSKSRGDGGLGALRAAGKTQPEIRRLVGLPIP